MSLSESIDDVDRREPDDLREANHRIANSLTLVSGLVRMQAADLAHKAQPLSPKEAGAALLEAASRIESVARLHRLLSNELDRGDLCAGLYLGDICNGVAGSMSRADRIVYLDESGLARLAPERLNALGLFLTEALTNALKHAHPANAPGRVDVTFKREGHDLQLEIADDGVGFPEAFQPLADGGLGFKIMRSLAGQMEADLTFPDRDFGVCIRLDLPVAVGVRRL
ncbi:MAG: sensor histidine kinase [Pseudomonadota bacterium]